MFFRSLAELINIIKNTDTAIIVLKDGDKIAICGKYINTHNLNPFCAKFLKVFFVCFAEM